jgi:NAD(P)H dehydrogenase (quinone)
MNVLIVYAHPDAQSLNGVLKDRAVRVLTEAGHRVEVSDLYAMNWKAVVDGEDFLERANPEQLQVAKESGKAFAEGSQIADLIAEQE